MRARDGLFVLLGAAALAAAAPFAADAAPRPPRMASAAPAAAQGMLADPAGPVRAALHDDPTTPRPPANVAPASVPTPRTAPAAQRLAALLTALDAGLDDASMVLPLRDVLLAHPDLAATFPSLVLEASRSDRGRLRLLQALERCGDGGCQAALATIGADATGPSSLRLPALRALGGVSLPTEATVAALWTLAHGGDEPAEAALRAFGRVAARLAGPEPEVHARSCRQLQEDLRRSTDARRTGALLKALASAGSPDAGREAIVRLADPEASVRASAVWVLLGCEGPHVEAIARDLLRAETDPEVRRILTRGLARRGHP